MDRIIGANTVDLGGGRRGFRAKDTVGGVPGTELTAAWHNAIQEEIVAAIEAIGLVPSNADTTQLRQVIRSGFFNWCVVGGSANGLTLDLTPNLAAYKPGLTLRMITGGAANTGPMTIDVDGLGPKPLLRRGGGAMAQGDVPANSLLEVVDVGAAFRCTGFVASDSARSRQIFIASGNLLVPAGRFRVWLRSWGGAAGGGGVSASGGAAGGGGGGEYREGIFDVTPGDNHTVTIGAGGPGGSNVGGNGVAGGATSVGALISAAGGSPGFGGNGTYGAGGLGGTGGTGGDFAQPGGNGSSGGNLGGTVSSGTGGGSWMVTNHYIQFSAGAGGNGLFYAQGGNGATGGGGAAVGGNGRSGLVIAEWL